MCWLTVVHAAEPLASSPWPFVAVLALFVAGELLHVDLVRAGDQGHSFAMIDVALGAALLLARPSDLVVAQVLATFVIIAVRSRGAVLKTLFNTAQAGLSACMAVAVFAAVGATQQVSARAALAALSGVLASTFVSAALVWAVVRASGGRRSTDEFLHTLLISTLTAIANAAIAVQAVFLGQISLFLVPLAAMPFVVLVVAYRGMSNQQLTVDKTDFLYRATAALHREADLDSALIEVLDHAREAVHADAARIVLLAHDGAVACASSPVSVEPMAATKPRGRACRAPPGQRHPGRHPRARRHRRSIGVGRRPVQPQRLDRRATAARRRARRRADRLRPARRRRGVPHDRRRPDRPARRSRSAWLWRRASSSARCTS